MKADWILIAKVFAGEANEEEAHSLETWSQQNEENKQLIDMLKKNWDSVEKPGEKIRVDVDRAWSDLHGRLESEKLIPDEGSRTIRFTVPVAIRIAASLALLIALGTFSYLMLSPGGQDSRMTASTGNQQEFGLQLPDGSGVDLNAGTKLSYKLDKSGIRMVTLQGEAWFDVRHDSENPFVIQAGSGMVRVTGTSFSVRSLQEYDRTEVYVESGRVSLYRSGQGDRILELQAGQMGILEQNTLSREHSPEPNHLSWKTRKLVFRDTRLGDVAGVLNRTYSQDIRFNNESLEDCLFTGTFDQQPMDSVVRVIQVAFGLDMEHDGKAYVFSGDGCN
jgi:ferric-dicitrate binding protein FerR (iron transport regulator)